MIKNFTTKTLFVLAAIFFFYGMSLQAQTGPNITLGKTVTASTTITTNPALCVLTDGDITNMQLQNASGVLTDEGASCMPGAVASSTYTITAPTGCPTNVIYGQNGGSVYVVNATTFALISTYGGGANSYSLAVPNDGFAYMVANNLGGGGTISKTNLTTGAVTNSVTLPTVQSNISGGQTWYISGSADPQGNIYFVTARGENLYKVNPATGVLTTVWKMPGSGGPAGPPPPTAGGFTSQGMDMSMDANGDLYFIEGVSKNLWQVPAGTLTPINRGVITGVVGSSNDIFFANGSVYIAASSTNKIYKVNMGTMTATAVTVPGSTPTFTDGAGTICDLLSLAPLNGKVVIDPNGQTGGVNGTPTAGVTVTLYAANGTTVVATTTTDTDGKYHFNNLAANTSYVVVVTPPTGMQNVSSTDTTPLDGRTTVTTPASGNVTTSIDFGVNTPPAANDDSSTGNPAGPVSIGILANDTLSDGSTATTATTTVALNTTGLPSGSTVSANGLTVTVPGEGTWVYDPTTGQLTFTPQAGFTGNPTPVTYTLTETATGLIDTATVTVKYDTGCYKPAATSGTVLDTNTGISALGRGNDDTSGWPQVRKGAWIALESKEKGFVVNRATTAQVNAIASPVEGMMVYDQDVDCLKIYTSTDNGNTFGWFCLVQGCPD